mmetsp:Transcript_26788/g.43379  ORF Transcript_26788/g.43379 Transcript_26788/m.43379 type:complete len:333 (-) Transcript_26788:372-1370(-)
MGGTLCCSSRMSRNQTKQLMLPMEMDESQMTPILYKESLERRSKKVFNQFIALNLIDKDRISLKVFPSKYKHYRMRVGFGLYDSRNKEAYRHRLYEQVNDGKDDDATKLNYDEEGVIKKEKKNQQFHGTKENVDHDYDDDTLCHVIWHAGKMLRVNNFPIASEKICEKMPLVIEYIRTDPVLRRGIRGAKYLCSSNGQVVLTLIYKSRKLLNEEEEEEEEKEDGEEKEKIKKKGQQWSQRAEEMLKVVGLYGIIGRSKNVRVVIGSCFVVEDGVHLADGRSLKYKHIEGSFSNPNLSMSICTLNWMTMVAKDLSSRIKRSLKSSILFNPVCR